MATPPQNSSRPNTPHPAPIRAKASIQDDFLAHRAKLLDLAAYFDRADRYGVNNHALDALKKAIAVLNDDQQDRAKRLLELLSDESIEPLDQSPSTPVIGVRHPTSRN